MERIRCLNSAQSPGFRVSLFRLDSPSPLCRLAESVTKSIPRIPLRLVEFLPGLDELTNDLEPFIYFLVLSVSG